MYTFWRAKVHCGLSAVLSHSQASYLSLTSCMKTLAGLNAGILCSGMMMVVFLEMLRAVFSERTLMMKLPKPRRYTFSPLASESLTTSMNFSIVSSTLAFSRPVVFEISLTMSALVIVTLFCLCYYIQLISALMNRARH